MVDEYVYMILEIYLSLAEAMIIGSFESQELLPVGKLLFESSELNLLPL